MLRWMVKIYSRPMDLADLIPLVLADSDTVPG
jgi:hypothetical protein